MPAGRSAGLAWSSSRGCEPAARDRARYVLTQERQARRLSMVDFPTPVEALLRIKVPKTFDAKHPQQRRDLAVVLRDRTRDLPTGNALGRGDRRSGHGGPRDRRAASRHPLAPVPPVPGPRGHTLAGPSRCFNLERETNKLRQRIEKRTNTIARQFDRVCDVLRDLAYLEDEQVTPAGEALARIYSELDLLAAECAPAADVGRVGDAGARRRAVSAGVRVQAAGRQQRPRLPGGAVRTTLESMTRVWAELEGFEREHGVDFLREPDFGFAWAAYRWAGGATSSRTSSRTSTSPPATSCDG